MDAGDRICGEIWRLKREDCSRTKHDREFSKWEILIGPCDWEDYSLGKEGAERYRVHNLPKNSGPGVYELGIAVCQTSLGREVSKVGPDRIVVVYLGQADNVRTRLQHYGRSGSHLGNSASIGASNDCKTVSLQKGPGLFEEILSRGHPIVFRWAAMQGKSDALRTETRLLRTFDYAWNTSTNGTRHPNDVLQKLKKISSSTPIFSDIAQKLMPFSQRQVGIRIDEESHSLFSGVLKFGRSRPRLVVQDSVAAVQDYSTICGVVLGGQNSICQNPPVEGRKRCSEHKGMRTKASVSAGPCSSHGSKETQPVTVIECASSSSSEPICGFVLANGYACKSSPVRGNRRCIRHKGRRICKPDSAHDLALQSDMSEIGSQNRANNSCSVHKGMRTKASVSAGPCSSHCSKETQPVTVIDCASSSSSEPICGFVLANGYACKSSPVRGNKRCIRHKGRRICKPDSAHDLASQSDMSEIGSQNRANNRERESVCGVVSGNGLVCTKRPVVGRVRCEEHKG